MSDKTHVFLCYSKTTEWEKNRRCRINEQFKQLWQALPVYDASKPLSKPEILSQAATALRELDERLRNLLSAQGAEPKLKGSPSERGRPPRLT